MFNEDLLSQFHQLETPFYFYNLNLLKTTLQQAKSTSEKRNFHVHYAYKANFNDKILQLMHEFGFGDRKSVV